MSATFWVCAAPTATTACQRLDARCAAGMQTQAGAAARASRHTHTTYTQDAHTHTRARIQHTTMCHAHTHRGRMGKDLCKGGSVDVLGVKPRHKPAVPDLLLAIGRRRVRRRLGPPGRLGRRWHYARELVAVWDLGTRSSVSRAAMTSVKPTSSRPSMNPREEGATSSLLLWALCVALAHGHPARPCPVLPPASPLLSSAARPPSPGWQPSVHQWVAAACLLPAKHSPPPESRRMSCRKCSQPRRRAQSRRTEWEQVAARPAQAGKTQTGAGSETAA